MSSSRSAPGAAHGEAASGPPLAFPTIALKALEPCDGGCWLVTDQNNDSFQLSYFVNGNSVAVTYIMQPCTTLEQLRQRCGEHLYDATRAQRTNGTVVDPRSYFHAASPAPNVHSNSGAVAFQPPLPGTSGSNQSMGYSNASSTALNNSEAQVNNVSGSGASPLAESPFVSEPSSAGVVSQPSTQLDWPMSEPQTFSHTNSVEPDWALSNELFPETEFTFMGGDFSANCDENGNSLSGLDDPSKFTDDGWSSAEMRESWESMFPSP